MLTRKQIEKIVMSKEDQLEFAKTSKPFEYRDNLGVVKGLRSPDGNVLILNATTYNNKPE